MALRATGCNAPSKHLFERAAPDGHKEHDVLPRSGLTGATTMCPLAHTAHVDAPLASLYVPCGQMAHAGKFRNEKFPGLHWAIDSEVGHSEPYGHSVGMFKPIELHRYPRGHAIGAVAFVPQKKPRWHCPEIADRPVVLQNEPPGHASGADRPARGQ